MNRTKFQTRLKQPKIKTATQFQIDSYTKYENKKFKNNLNILYRLNFLKQKLNQIKKQKTARQHEQNDEQHKNKKNTNTKIGEDT